ncbi:MAG: TonB-dependent receptor [Bacteroidota bacterium]
MRVLFFVVFIGYSLLLRAQEDTVKLSEVKIYGDPIHLFTIGQSIEKISIKDSDISLSDALSRNGGLYLRSYGNHQLSTITLRGTSANQTNVLWHGIPVNYPTLGQMDFSQWPTWFLSSVELQVGSAGALFGSGSIGGTVLLDSDIDSGISDPGISLRGDVGSFGYNFLGFKGRYSLGKVAAQTKVYRSQIENDFTYIYNEQELVQHNAGSTEYGFQQQLQWEFKRHRLQFDGMYAVNAREIQPSKGATGTDQLKTSNTRLALTHENHNAFGSWNNSLAYIRNSTLYNQIDQTVVDQYSLVSSLMFEVGDHFNFRVGVNSNVYNAQSDNYVNQLDDFRTGTFGSIGTDITEFWDLAINLRQSFFNHRFPFNPAVNQKIRFFSNDTYQLNLTQSVGTGFRFPTLNELYWVPGGNPDLKPERSLSTDFGLSIESSGEQIKWYASLEMYKMWSQDYILWIPGSGGIWSPENYQDVHINGVEIEGSLSMLFGKASQKFTGSYTYSLSINQTGNNSGNQLPYVPIHQASLISESTWQNWFVDLSANYTSQRFTTLDNIQSQSVEGFFLIDLELKKSFALDQFRFILGFEVNNLTDVDYENLINRAMPGRNYQLHILLNR